MASDKGDSNIMVKAYENFNQYERNGEEVKKPKLFLRVPNREISKNALFNYCAQYGRVRELHLTSQNGSNYLVAYPTLRYQYMNITLRFSRKKNLKFVISFTFIKTIY